MLVGNKNQAKASEDILTTKLEQCWRLLVRLLILSGGGYLSFVLILVPLYPKYAN